MLYQKIDKVEARQYDGPKITVVNDALGEQTAQSGDWLLGTERGKIRVVSNAAFQADYTPYSETPADDQVKVLEATIDQLKAEKDGVGSDYLAAVRRSTTLDEQLTILQNQVNDLAPKAAQVDAMTEKLAAAEAKAASDESTLAQLTEEINAFKDAQAKAASFNTSVQQAAN
jgi:hypothetical protein